MRLPAVVRSLKKLLLHTTLPIIYPRLIIETITRSYRTTYIHTLKPNLRDQVLFSRTDFLPWEFLLIKKLEFDKTKPTQYTTFKTDIIKVVLVFSISNFFINKNSQGRKSVREKKYLLLQIQLQHIRQISTQVNLEHINVKINFW